MPVIRFRSVFRIFIVLLLFFTACKSNNVSGSLSSDKLFDDSINEQYDNFLKYQVVYRHPYGELDTLYEALHSLPYVKSIAQSNLAMFKLSMAYWSLNCYDSSIFYMEKVRPYFETQPTNTKLLFYCYRTLGACYRNQGTNSFKANYYSTKAAALSLIPGMDTTIPFIYRVTALYNAAETGMDYKQYEQSLRFCKIAAQLIYPFRDSLAYDFVRTQVILTLINEYMHRYDAARINIELAERASTTPVVSPIASGLEEAKASYYYSIQQYDSSLSCLLRYVDASIDHIYYWARILRIYVLLDKTKEASYILQKAEKSIAGRTNEVDLAFFYNYKIRYLIKHGKRVVAMQVFRTYDSLMNDINNSERLKIFSSIESEYNLADKQKNIVRLDRMNKATQEEIRHKNNQLVISILVILLLGVGVIIFFLLARQRKLLAANQFIEAQRDKIQLQQRLLRTQIEPQFIFNTLGTMKDMVHERESEKAMRYLDKFARLLRTSLENSRENYVPVVEEIEALQDYVSLQAIRFDNKFDYVFKLYEGYKDDDICIPPMLIQPFVEQAVQCNIDNSDKLNTIHIRIEKYMDSLCCTISYNGSEIQHLVGINKKEPSAISIAKERLAIVSRETKHPASIDIEQTGQNTYLIKLLIPYTI